MCLTDSDLYLGTTVSDDIYDPIDEAFYRGTVGCFGEYESTILLPVEVLECFDFGDEDPLVHIPDFELDIHGRNLSKTTLSTLNDEGMTFREIALIIERSWL